MSEETVWKRLTRLFRSGPVVRHKIAGGEKLVEPQGTAKAFKKELSSLYVRALASYANYERLSRYSDYNEMEYTPELHTALDIYCLAGDSRVLMADGVKKISELFEQGREDFYVYSFDVSTDRFVPGLCRRVMKTGIDQPVFRVNLDNGNFVRLTSEHLVLLSDGSYRAVCDLVPGDHIRSLYRNFSSKEKGDWIDGYERILQPNGKWQYSHRIVAEYFGCGNRGDVVHHIDFHKLNNNPSNLQFMSWNDHAAVHHVNNSERWKSDPQFAKRMAAKFSVHAKKMHAQPGWTKEVFLKARNELFASYTDDERREKFGRPGEQNGQFGRGDLHAGSLTGRFNRSIDRVFTAEQLKLFMDEALTIREAAERLNTLVPVIRSEMKRLGIPRWSANRKPRTKLDEELILTLKKEAHFVGDSAGRLFGEICSKIGIERGTAYLQLKLAGYKNWGDFIGQTNHIVTSIIEDGSCDVFDLEVEGLHNFAISGQDGDDFVIVHNSDEATVKSDEGNVVEITSPNAEIKDILETLFFDVIDINFNAWSWMRHFVKFGDFVLFVDANEGNGILNLIPIPINEIEREEGYDPKDPMAVRFRWLTRGNTILENWQVIHFRLLGNDAYLPYGSSVLEPARRIWRQLILIEDAMLVYRIVRSPERRVFHIEIANTPPDQVDAFMEQVRTQLKRNTIVDPQTGRVDLRYNPLSVEEDYILPKRGEQKSDITTLPGGQFTGDIDDVQYIQSKMFAAIKIPKAYLGYDEGIGSKCLSPSTKISLLDGRELPIVDLCAEHDSGIEHWLYSITLGGEFVPSRVKRVWASKQVMSLMRVTLDNGEVVECTDNHPFMLRDGTYRRADLLTSGDSLMPLYRKLSSSDDGDRIIGYEKILDNASGTWELTHHVVDRQLGAKSIAKGRVIHHIDCDKRNNSPTNLREMTWFEHRRWHQQHAALTLHTPEARAKAAPKLAEWRSSERARKMWRAIGAKTSAPGTKFDVMIHSPEFSGVMSDVMQRNWEDPKYRELKSSQNREIWNNPVVREKLSGDNHWVRRKHAGFDIEWLTQYCISNSIKEKRFFSGKKNATPIGQRKLLQILKGGGFNGWRDFFNERLRSTLGAVTVKRNHSVVSVEVISLQSAEWVYDIEVESENHNFALSAGIYTHNSTLAQEDVRFAKTIERIQGLFVSELNKIAIIHLFLCGHSGADLTDFTISMANPSTIAAQQRLELWRMKLEVAGMAQEGVFDRGFIYRKIFGLNDKQIATIKDGKRIDKLEDTLLQSIETPPEPPGAPEVGGPGGTPGLEAAPAAGAEDLPDTLGGPEPGAAPPSVPPQNASRSLRGPVIREKKNMGSTGDRAEVAVDKGKDLFSTGESPLALSFGTEKQTASDPSDRRAARRLITRPFSEESDCGSDPVVVEIDAIEEMLGRYATAIKSPR